MKRRWIILATTIGIAATAIVLLLVGTGAAESETSRVRLVHAVPGGPAIRVLVDGEIAYPEVSYTTVTTYTTLAAGLHTVEIKDTLFNISLISATLPLTGGMDLSVMGIGTMANPTVTLLVDDNRPANEGKLRVVNLAPTTGAITVSLAAEATAIVGDLAYKEASEYFGGIGWGVLSVQVSAGGVPKTLVPPTTTIRSNAIHTLFIMGTGDPLRLVAAVDQEFEPYKIWLPLVRAPDGS